MSKIDVLGQDRPQDNAEFEYFNEACKYHRMHAVRDNKAIVEHLHGALRILETSKNQKRLSNCKQVKLEGREVHADYADCLLNRTSCRNFANESITLGQLSILLNQSAGFTRTLINPAFAQNLIHLRPYPSGGGLFPVDIYVIGLNVSGISPFIAHYCPIEKCLYFLKESIDTDAVKKVFMLKDGTKDVPVIIVFGGVFMRSTAKYGTRGYRFALLEAGHAAQNICLTAVAQGLGSLAWSSYYDDELNQLLGIDGNAESAIHSVLIGHKNDSGE